MRVTVDGVEMPAGKPFRRAKPEEWSRSHAGKLPFVRSCVSEAHDGGWWCLIEGRAAMTTDDARSLAAWLIKAADWIEAKGGR